MAKNNASLVSVKTDLEWIKSILKDMQTEIKGHNDKLDEVSINLKNHLVQHETLRREMFTKLGLFLTAIGITSAIILKMWLG